jgi:TctA family transporter
MSRESAAKGIAMTVIGMLLGTVGTDITTGIERFDFGSAELADGIELASLAMG